MQVVCCLESKKKGARMALQLDYIGERYSKLANKLSHYSHELSSYR